MGDVRYKQYTMHIYHIEYTYNIQKLISHLCNKQVTYTLLMYIKFKGAFTKSFIKHCT